MDLLEVVRRILNGNESAWEQFLPSFYEVGRRTLRTFRFPEDDENEILSQVLYKLFSGGLRSFRGASPGELAMYLKQMVRNQALTIIKKRKSEEVDSEALNDVPSDGALLDDRIADEECLRLLEKIVQSLPLEDRELYLRVSLGQKVRDIAQEGGNPLGTVGARISRLKERIRESLRTRGCL